MSWYKKAVRYDDYIVFLSYSSYGDLKVLIKGKPYNYVEVLPNKAEYLQKLIKHHNWTSAFPLLQSFKQEKELYKNVPEDKVDLGGNQLELDF